MDRHHGRALGQPRIGSGMLHRVTTFVSRYRSSRCISSIKYIWRKVDSLVCWIVVVRELSLNASNTHIVDVVIGKHEFGDFLPRKVGLKWRLGVQLKFTFQFAAYHKTEDSKYKNYAGYGEFLDENFIHLLENGANTTAPAAPLTGQLWWDKTNTLLKVYNGTVFKTISAATASATQPASNVTGDLWYDTTNQQVKVYTGSSFIVVGPAFTSTEGTAGAIPETVNDNTATPHYITGLYVAGTRVAIVSKDANFTAAAPTSTLFPTIYKGITISNSADTVMAGNVRNTGNVVVTSGGATTAVIQPTGVLITGFNTVTGNVTGGNILTAGVVSATGNVTGLNFIGNVIAPPGGPLATTGNISGGNLLTSGLASATGNITGGNINTAGLVTATGNVRGGNVISVAAVSGVSIVASGNVDSGNLRSAGLISVAGNVTSAANIAGTFFIGNGSQLTGLSLGVSVTKFVNGTTEGAVGVTNGNINFNVGGVANVVVIDTSTVYANVVSVASIAKTGTNAVGNIGSSSNYFNQVFAQATTALYADVAERFASDELLEPGTVVELGGAQEITRSLTALSEKVFGVISTRPAYTMNGGAGEDDTHPKVAMTGRVPVKVTGYIRKGDRLVAAGDGIARAAQPGEATAFNVIGRSLVDKTTPESGTIEAIVTIKN